MKKILLILVLLVISCSEEDTSPQEESLTKEDLMGTWEITAAKMNGTVLELDECFLKQGLNFTSSSLTYIGSYLTNADGTKKCMEYTESHTYTIEGKQIKIPNSDLGVNYRAVVDTQGDIQLTTNSGNGNAMIQTFTKR